MSFSGTRLVLIPLGLVLGLACRPRTTPPPSEPPWGSVADTESQRAPVKREAASEGESAPVFELLEQELQTHLTALGEGAVEEPVYFLAYDVVARRELWIEAQEGVLVRRDLDGDRTLDVDVRVGSRQLDNSHAVDGNY